MARLTPTWLTLAAAGGASVTGVGAFDPARDGGLRAGVVRRNDDGVAV